VKQNTKSRYKIQDTRYKIQDTRYTWAVFATRAISLAKFCNQRITGSTILPLTRWLSRNCNASDVGCTILQKSTVFAKFCNTMVAGCAIDDFAGHNKYSNLESRPSLRNV